MEDKKKKQPETKDIQKSVCKPEKPQIKDIDDLIFEDEYIKKHSEK